jgi:1-deoxy-D-xylulose-5-phosphate reductoisomerase
MVEFVDHSVLAQLSQTDMCFPIQYAVTYPKRLPTGLPQLDFAKLGQLLFEAPDPVRFPALRLAREAGMAGGTLPAVMNAANEVAVERFLQEKGTFPEIWETVERVMGAHENIASPDLDAILRADDWARKQAAV